MKVNGIGVKKVLKFRATSGFGKWKKYFPKEAVSHPAKLNLFLLEYLILNYTKEGEVIVDVMAGTGSTGVQSVLSNRNCICCDLEDKFCEWMRIAKDNVDKEPTLTPKGKMVVIQGDSRKLSKLLKEHAAEISTCLFSPPYASSFKHNPQDKQMRVDKLRKVEEKFVEEGRKWSVSSDEALAREVDRQDWGYGDAEGNIGNLPVGNLSLSPSDCILFSPPYSSAGVKADENPENYLRRAKERYELMKQQGIKRPETEPGRYSGSWGNIGNLPYVDACIFSPPFGPAQKGGGIAIHGYEGEHGKDESLHLRHDRPLSEDAENISNPPPYSLGHSSGPHASEEHSWMLEEQHKHTEAYGGGNIAKLPFVIPDAVIFSPPYSVSQIWISEQLRKDKFKGRRIFEESNDPRPHSAGQIGDLPFGVPDAIEEEYDMQADSVLTSPPYFDSKSDWDETSRARREGEEVAYSDERHQERENIGNVHYYDEGEPIAKKYAKANDKETYLQAMFKVYSECWKILKHDGLMILILKNFIRDKKLVPLTEHTIKLCESVGFTLKERLLFKLPTTSFWRTLGKKKWEEEGREYPDDLSYEHVLVFVKK